MNTMINFHTEQKQDTMKRIEELEQKNYGGCQNYFNGCHCAKCMKAWELQKKVNGVRSN